MKIDLSAMKAIDVHCHPFLPNKQAYSNKEFLKELSLSLDQEKMFNMNGRLGNEEIYPGMNMYMQLTIRHLAKYFNCEPTLDAVVQKRNELAVDFPKYTQSLFEDVNLAGMVVDYGYPRPEVSREKFNHIVGLVPWEIIRIEQVMNRLREEITDLGDYLDQYRAEIRTALERDNVIGLKSTIAYRSGLDVEFPKENEIKEHFEEYIKDVTARAKKFRDYLFHIGMEECTKANKAMHIHTGVGNGYIILSKASPSLLTDVVNAYQDTNIHLVHGGYPWMEEAAFLSSILPNVYLDISLQVPFAGDGTQRIMERVFEFAPFNKVMYGSDGYSIPEMNWYGVKLFKEEFGKVLGSWVERDYMNEETATAIGKRVLYHNFEEAYKHIIK